MTDSNQDRLSWEELAPWRGPGWTAYPNWSIDLMNGNRELPISLPRFFFHLWRKTIGYQRIKVKISARDFASDGGIRREEVARWSRTFAAADLIDYAAAEYGQTRVDSSEYTLKSRLADPEVMELFFRAVIAVLADEKYGPDKWLKAEVFADRVATRMEEFRVPGQSPGNPPAP